MYRQEAREEYLQALRLGQRELKTMTAAGKNAYPEVLDELLKDMKTETVVEVGLVEIPMDQVVGIRSAGRTKAFTAGFRPLLPLDTEFAAKWINLCAAHLSEGIREPVLCYEYLGRFYLQEGNKRFSVLKHMGSPRITGQVLRVMPVNDGSPRYQAYKEFLEFYKSTGIYEVQFRRPGDYAELMTHLDKEPGKVWTEREKRNFSAYFHYFRDAFFSHGEELDLLPEEALLLWLRLYPFKDLGCLSTMELKKTVDAMWPDFKALDQPEPVQVRTEPVSTEKQGNVLTRMISGVPDHVNVAFVHPLDIQTSTWVGAHENGRQYMEETLGSAVTVHSYFNAHNPEKAEAVLEQAVTEGADVVFTTTSQLSLPTLKAALKYPKVRFLNCSVDTPYPSIRTYYSRIYEAKFITGAIAGAMANNDLIGYVGSNPIYGVPASINAFALGAKLTNPRAKVVLKWSCMAGSPQEELRQLGVQVISNRDVPTQDRKNLHFCNYGTYALGDDGLLALASPVWLWGQFYVNVIRSILAGTYDKDKDSPRAVNYWWGMDSGVIDVELDEHIPEGLLTLAQILRKGLIDGSIDPFRRHIVAQDGSVKNDGSRSLSPDEVLRMDWLCDNVEGHIPGFEELEAYAKPIVRQLGIYRDKLPAEKEGTP
jgi:basic membrane lipoprotein Med (substrate-binding protein (PBP1-ABC) superfamily)